MGMLRLFLTSKWAVLATAITLASSSFAQVLTGPVTNAANGHIYYLLTQGTWTESEEQARLLGGHLVTIDDQSEEDWVFSTFGQYGGVNRALWIGLNDVDTPGDFRWINGATSTYRNWAPGEPSVPWEQWVHMWPNGIPEAGQWNNAPNENYCSLRGLFWPLHGVVEVNGWKTFNDHGAGLVGSQTHANATTLNCNTAGSAILKNVSDGTATPVTLTIGITGTAPTTGNGAQPPLTGTPLASEFDGNAWFGVSASGQTPSAIQIKADGTIHYTFTGLNPDKRYCFKGGAVRGNNYFSRWTLVDISGVDAVQATHQQGAQSPYGYMDATRMPGVLTGNQAAFLWGENVNCGDMCVYTNIAPGSDGSFEITCTQFLGTPGTGVIPWGYGTFTTNGWANDTADYGYAISGLSLEELSVSPGWVAFNDHWPSKDPYLTAPFATRYDVFGTPPGNSGNLTNITDGKQLPVILTITTNLSTAVIGGRTAGIPNPGTPLANTFDGYVYFGTVEGTKATIQVPSAANVTYIFSGLDSAKRYRFQGGAVRGEPTYTNRWTLIDIQGIDSVTPNHQQGAESPWGILNSSMPGVSLTNYQAAILTGDNRWGDMVEWDNIASGSDGEFTVTCAQYMGPVPTGYGTSTLPCDNSNAPHVYALSGIRLEEISPVLTVSISPGDQTVSQCSSVAFHALASGGTPPYAYQWYKNNTATPVNDATNSWLTLSNAQPIVDDGNFFVVVADSTPVSPQRGSSNPSRLTVVPNAFLAVAGAPDLFTVTLSFLHPIGLASSTGEDFLIQCVQDGTTLPVTNAVLSNATNIILTTSAPRQAKTYQVSIQGNAVIELCSGSSFSGTVTLNQEMALLAFGTNSLWRYNQEGIDMGTAWKEYSYPDELSWPVGPAVFDGKIGGRTNIGGLTVGTVLQLTNINFAFGTNDIPSYYFRTHFTWPANVAPSNASVAMRTLLDDAAIVYINGREVWRSSTITTTNEPFSFYLGSAIGDASISNPVPLSPTNFIEDENVVAVYLKQGNDHSSDITMGLELTVSVTSFREVPSNPGVQRLPGTVVSWGSMVMPYIEPGTKFKSISAGEKHNLALKSTGTLFAWGWNDFGQSTMPAGLTGAVAIAAGGNHSLVLEGNGTVMAWGLNDYGESTVPAGLTNAIAIAAGFEHSIALKSNGSVIAWGANDFGQTNMPGGLTGVVAIACGTWHSLALKSNGTVIAWGDNGFGKCTVPAGLSGVAAIAAGEYHSLALKSNGTVVAWGDSGYYMSNVVVSLNGIIAIASGGGHSLALKSDGTVVAWGNNVNDQTNVPVELTGVVAISANGNHSLALKGDGTIIAWGDNWGGQSAIPPGLSGAVAIAGGGSWTDYTLALKSNGTVMAWGANAYGESTVPTGLSNVAAIAAGGYHSLALKSNGVVLAWGAGGPGRINWPHYGQSTIPADLNNVTAIGAGWLYSLALKSDGTVVAWGENSFGQTNVPADLNNVRTIAAGGGHCLGLKRDGTIVAWGDDGYGQITLPGGLTHTAAIAAGYYHSLALMSNGMVVGWGAGGPGQTNWPHYGQSTIPAGLTNVIAISASGNHSLALKSNGTLVSWGGNSYGESTLPNEMGTAVAINGGPYHSLAIAIPIQGSFKFATEVNAINESASNITINVTLRGESTNIISVAYETVDGTAIGGSDFVPVNGTLSFAPGETNQTIIVPILNDSIVEGNEVFSIRLFAPSWNWGISDEYASVTILDDEFNLNVLVQGVGTVSKQPDLPYYRTGDSVILTARTSCWWYAFSQWSDGLTTNPRTVIIGSNNSYTAIFTNTVLLETNTFNGVTRAAPVGMPMVFVGPNFVVTSPYTNRGPAQITILSTFPNANIFYTLDGSDPLSYPNLYQSPFVLRRSTRLRTVALRSNFTNPVEVEPIDLVLLPTLTVTTAGGGTVTVQPPDGPYFNGDTAIISCYPFADWNFLGWLGDATGIEPTVTLRMTRNKCVEAVFGTFLFTNVAVGSGEILLEPPAGPYPYGSSVRATAMPSPGFYFSSWAGDVGGTNNPVTLTITNPNPTIRASFVLGQYSLAIIARGGGRVNSNPFLSRYASGRSVTNAAIPDSNQMFLGWSGDTNGATLLNVTNLIVSMNSNRVITAHFTSRPQLSLPNCCPEQNADGYQFRVHGDVGGIYEIQASSNLWDWAALGLLTNSTGEMSFTDRSSTNVQRRMYRAVLP